MTTFKTHLTVGSKKTKHVNFVKLMQNLDYTYSIMSGDFVEITSKYADKGLTAIVIGEIGTTPRGLVSLVLSPSYPIEIVNGFIKPKGLLEMTVKRDELKVIPDKVMKVLFESDCCLYKSIIEVKHFKIGE